MYSQDPELEKSSKLVDAALIQFYEEGAKKTSNPYEGMCYVASVVLTSKQYSLKNIGVPSSGMAAKLKEQGRRMSFASYKKKEERLMEIIKELQAC